MLGFSPPNGLGKDAGLRRFMHGWDGVVETVTWSDDWEREISRRRGSAGVGRGCEWAQRVCMIEIAREK